MGSFICKLEERYFVYSDIVDAPTTPPLTLDEFKAWYAQEHGRVGMDGLARRLERVEATGTSSRVDGSVEEVVRCNVAGKDGTTLSIAELRAWCRGELRIPGAEWLPTLGGTSDE